MASSPPPTPAQDDLRAPPRSEGGHSQRGSADGNDPVIATLAAHRDRGKPGL